MLKQTPLHNQYQLWVHTRETTHLLTFEDLGELKKRAGIIDRGGIYMGEEVLSYTMTQRVDETDLEK